MKESFSQKTLKISSLKFKEIFAEKESLGNSQAEASAFLNCECLI